MNKTKVGLIAILIVILALFLWLKPENKTAKSSDSAFALNSETEISNIYLIRQDTLHLTLENKAWMVNRQELANQEMVNSLLHLIHNINIISPVNKSEQSEYRDQLISNGVHIILNDKEKNLRTYQLGFNNLSFAQLKGSDKVYFVETPGLDKNLLSYCSPEIEKWESNKPFAQWQNIETLELIFPDNEADNYRLILNNNPVLLSNNSVKNQAIDSKAIGTFIHQLADISFLNNNLGIDASQIDSVLRSKPFLAINTLNPEKSTYLCYKKPGFGKKDAFDLALKFDPNIFYLFIPGKGLVECNYAKIDFLFIGF